jgi:predicted DNA-binding transcriptional regulator YafY
MNRIDRISAILTQLQSKKVVKGQDIADRFGMSLRTVYRDIKALEEAGVPIIGNVIDLRVLSVKRIYLRQNKHVIYV